jgi:hypothetical protein
MKEIAIWGQNKETKEKYIKAYAMVDDEDYDKVNSRRWNLNRKGYAYTHPRKDGVMMMHRLIMDCPKGMVVDHRNHNTLDNRKENLRICTKKENVRNSRGKKLSSSKFKGVTFVNSGSPNRKRWQAHISCDGVKETIGWFNTELAAALARNKRESELFGEFACLNELPCSEKEIIEIEQSFNTKTSKYIGVNYNKTCRQWMARLQHNFKSYYLGLFPTEESAWLAVCNKRSEVS